jgi:hypothetical protein
MLKKMFEKDVEVNDDEHEKAQNETRILRGRSLKEIINGIPSPAASASDHKAVEASIKASKSVPAV